MINIAQAIHQLYPQVVRTEDNVAYDAEGNEVIYDLKAVTEKAEANAKSQEASKASALAKLSALGLTQDEIKALVG